MNVSPTLLVVLMEIAGASSPDSLAPEYHVSEYQADAVPIVSTPVTVRKQPTAFVSREPYPTASEIVMQTARVSPVSPTSPAVAASTDAAEIRAGRSPTTGASSVEIDRPDPSRGTAAPLPNGVMPGDLALTNCYVDFDKRKDVTIGANVQGELVQLRLQTLDEQGNALTVPIREGLTVKAGQILGYQDDRTPKAALKVAEGKLFIAKAEAEKEEEVAYAHDAILVDQARVDKYLDINNAAPRTVPDMDIREAQLKVKQSTTQWRLTKYNLLTVKKTELELQEAEVDAAKVAVEKHRFTAPFDGMVLEVKRTEGEWLREGDPILRIVHLDTLTIRTNVDATRYTPDMLEGRPVTVYAPSVNGQAVEFPGRVVFANPEVKAGEKFEIHIEVHNRQIDGAWQLRKGTMINAVVHLNP
ncbi:MAG TPA: hypothetical protein DEB39_06620 [Planctomycetaceae bacterium]|nr:hypothetical protein [Planctomycetaceae bacterium]